MIKKFTNLRFIQKFSLQNQFVSTFSNQINPNQEEDEKHQLKFININKKATKQDLMKFLNQTVKTSNIYFQRDDKKIFHGRGFITFPNQEEKQKVRLIKDQFMGSKIRFRKCLSQEKYQEIYQSENQKKIKLSRIFIYKIPQKCTEQQLMDLFKPYGEIKYFTYLKYENSARIQYCEIDHAKKACEKHNTKINDKKISVYQGFDGTKSQISKKVRQVRKEKQKKYASEDKSLNTKK